MVAPRGGQPAPPLVELEEDYLRPTQCRRPIRLIGYTADGDTGEIADIVEVTSRCRSWRDEGCGVRLKQLHQDFVRAGIDWHGQKGRLSRLLTITFPVDEGAQFDDPDDVAHVTGLVTRLIQEIRRTHPKRLEYYAVKESTKRGRLHVHLVTSGPYLHKCLAKRLKGHCVVTGCKEGDNERPCHNPCHRAGGCVDRLQQWQEDPYDNRGRRCKRPRPCVQAIGHRLGMGWVDVRKIGSGKQAARYLSKYLGKQVGQEWPRYSRRVTYSLGRLKCETHPDQNGRRCCPDAHRTTGYCPPLTIGGLWDQASMKALEYGQANGYIPIENREESDLIQIWEYAGRAAPPRAPPNSELSELEVIRRHNRVIDTRPRRAGLEPNNRLHAEAIRQALTPT